VSAGLALIFDAETVVLFDAETVVLFDAETVVLPSAGTFRDVGDIAVRGKDGKLLDPAAEDNGIPSTSDMLCRRDSQ
jgi:hypothetical protein